MNEIPEKCKASKHAAIPIHKYPKWIRLKFLMITKNPTKFQFDFQSWITGWFQYVIDPKNTT